jgi:aldehyde:ferredoxin oxidoreductase
LTEKYHNLGTSENILVLNELKGLQPGTCRKPLLKAWKISPEKLCRKISDPQVSCAGCPIGCVHIAMLKRPFSKAHEYETLTYLMT